MEEKKMERLDKQLGLLGYTRSEARRIITSGRVRVRGDVVRDPARKAPAEEIQVDGRELPGRKPLHIMLYKPEGVITATEDGRDQTIYSLLPEEVRRRKPGPVGRLDKDATGFVLLTTDGELAHRLISPKWKMEKKYRVACEGRLSEEEAERFRGGIALSDFTTQPAGIRTLEESNVCSIYEVAITEGKYHQIKRMFGALGHPVRSLYRFSIAGIELDPCLKEGEFRILTPDEEEMLYKRTELG